MARKFRFRPLRFGRRTLNVRWLAAVLSVVVLAPASLITLHSFQSSRNLKFLLERVDALSRAGERDRALQALRVYLGVNPGDESARRRLGLLLAGSNNVREASEARDILSLASTKHPDDAEVRSALLQLLLRLGSTAEAVKLAGQMEASNPSAAVWKLIADAYVAGGEDKRALAAVQKAVSADPKNLASYPLYLSLLYRASLNRAALEDAVQAMLDASDRPALAELVAYAALRDAGAPNPEQHLRRALQLAPDDVEVLLMAAGESFASDPAAAGRHLADAYKAAPNDERVLLTYGRWLAWSGRFERALALFEAGRRLGGRHALDFDWRAAEALVELGRFDECKPFLSELLQSRAYLPAYHYVSARRAIADGRLDQAGEHLATGSRLLKSNGVGEPGLTADADELAYKFDLARSAVAFRKGEWAESARWAEAAREILPRESAPWIALGRIEYERGDYDASIHAWSRAMEAPFHPPGAGLGLARSWIARMLEQPASQRDLQPILPTIEEARRLAPNDPNLPLVEADAWWGVGDVDAAVEILTAASQAHPRDPAVAMSLVHALIADRRLDQADRALARYEEAFGRDVSSVLAAAASLAARGGFEEALERVASYRADAPSEAAATLSRIEGQIQWLAGRNEAADNALRQAVKLDPDDDLAWLFRWIWLLDQGRTAEAKRMIEDARRARGDASPFGRWAEAVLAAESNPDKLSAAGPQLAKAAADLRGRHPFRWETYHVSGLANEAAGKDEDAVRDYLRALANGPAPPQLAARLIPLLLEKERLADADGAVETIRRQRLPLPSDRILRELLLAAPTHGPGASVSEKRN
jgi:tetratricopeptide (TPR) repeat protein